MSKGLIRVTHFGATGFSRDELLGDWGIVYKVSAVKDPKYEIGDVITVPGGREFTYSKSVGACKSGQGAEFTTAGLYGAVASVAGAIDDKKIVVAAGTHDAVTKDVLRGGYVIIHNASNEQQFRGIIGNDAADANAIVTIYLDAPLVAVVAVTILVEVFHNPFAALRTSTDVTLAVAGVPAATVSATGLYFWCQTKGFCFVAAQSGITGKQQGACWRHDGTLDTVDNGVEDSAIVRSQYAGSRVLGSIDLVGPLFKLV